MFAATFAGFDLSVADADDVGVEVHLVDGRWPVVTVDGVYRHPESVRELALSLAFQHRNGNHPGTMASISLSLAPLMELLRATCFEHLGRAVEPHRYYLDHVFALIDGDPAGLNPRQRQPHYDDFCDAAAVIYLNEPEQCSGGTSIWRHRSTGLVRVPDSMDDEWAAEAIVATRSPNVQQLVRHCLDEALPDPGHGFPSAETAWWTPELQVPMRWNRLVVYDARLFHTPDVPQRFGDRPETGRLTQNLFFANAPGQEWAAARRA